MVGNGFRVDRGDAGHRPCGHRVWQLGDFDTKRQRLNELSERFWLSLGIAIAIVLIVFVLATLSDQW